MVSGTQPDSPRPALRPNTCSRCDAEWRDRRVAHCGGCCETFASVALFDAHRSQDGPHGTCIPPGEVQGRNGEQRLFFRDGMWRGPRLSEEQMAEMGWRR